MTGNTIAALCFLQDYTHGEFGLWLLADPRQGNLPGPHHERALRRAFFAVAEPEGSSEADRENKFIAWAQAHFV